MIRIITGQRWTSDAEPELGLGRIAHVERRRVQIEFPACGEVRLYASDSAPIRRVQLRVGDRVYGKNGECFRLTAVTEKAGLLCYHGEGVSLPEIDLSDHLDLNTPAQRLLAGLSDPPSMFGLRTAALAHQHRWRQSPVRGFLGARIDLFAHQLYIAADASTRSMPRVLLADETGLGKTIESCLILKRLIVSGRVARVLILTPEPLVLQWFVELLRRFDLSFQIVDEDFCQAVAEENPQANPFLARQLMLTSLTFISADALRAKQALTAGWDLLVVDEAHHLQTGSPVYDIVAALGREVPRLLLLTATPEQLGRHSHFERLRLLDPRRYFDYEQFRQEAHSYRRIADLAGKLLRGAVLKKADKALYNQITDGLLVYRDRDPELLSADERCGLIDQLVDLYGPSRVMYRNTRASVPGFAERCVYLKALDAGAANGKHLQALADTFAAETADLDPDAADISFVDPDFTKDARIDWLAGLLRRCKTEKVLLICRSVAKVRAIKLALEQRINADVTVFHEKMSLLQRDRHAAWFADPEGAQLLICSEIGSEGRNFQFASHLVLFDLPLDPEQLEQRIGRLDRIGQRGNIRIHVPYLIGSPQEVLARWYHEGLDQFATHFAGGTALMEAFASKLRALAIRYHRSDSQDHRLLEDLIAETAQLNTRLTARLAAGRDRLLEIGSCKTAFAQETIDAIERMDKSQRLDHFMLALFDLNGIEVDPLSDRTYALSAGIHYSGDLPHLQNDQISVTFDRDTAVKREDLVFLNWDHPMVSGAIEKLLGSQTGNTTICLRPHAKTGRLILDAVFVLECVCPPILYVDRYLPPTPVRVAISHDMKYLSVTDPSLAAEGLEAMTDAQIREQMPMAADLLNDMLSGCRRKAEQQCLELIDTGIDDMEMDLCSDIQRLSDLSHVNPDIQPEEIEAVATEMALLEKHMRAARPRLDALRLIWEVPSQ